MPPWPPSGSQLAPITLSDSDTDGEAPAAASTPRRRRQSDQNHAGPSSERLARRRMTTSRSPRKTTDNISLTTIDFTLSSDEETPRPPRVLTSGSNGSTNTSRRMRRTGPQATNFVQMMDLDPDETMAGPSTPSHLNPGPRPSSQSVPRKPPPGTWGNPVSMNNASQVARVWRASGQSSQAQVSASGGTPKRSQTPSSTVKSPPSAPRLGSWGNPANLADTTQMATARGTVPTPPSDPPYKPATPRKADKPALGTWGNPVTLSTVRPVTQSQAGPSSIIPEQVAKRRTTATLSPDDAPIDPVLLAEEEALQGGSRSSVGITETVDSNIRESTSVTSGESRPPLGSWGNPAPLNISPRKPRQASPVNDPPNREVSPDDTAARTQGPAPGSWGNFIIIGPSTLTKRPGSRSPDSHARSHKRAKSDLTIEPDRSSIIPQSEANEHDTSQPEKRYPSWNTRSPFRPTINQPEMDALPSRDMSLMEPATADSAAPARQLSQSPVFRQDEAAPVDMLSEAAEANLVPDRAPDEDPTSTVTLTEGNEVGDANTALSVTSDEVPEHVEERIVEVPEPVEERLVEMPEPVEEINVELPKTFEEIDVEVEEPIEEPTVEVPEPVDESLLEQPEPTEERFQVSSVGSHDGLPSGDDMTGDQISSGSTAVDASGGDTLIASPTSVSEQQEAAGLSAYSPIPSSSGHVNGRAAGSEPNRADASEDSTQRHAITIADRLSPAPSSTSSIQEIDRNGRPLRHFSRSPVPEYRSVKPPGMDTLQWLRLKAKMRVEQKQSPTPVEVKREPSLASPLSAVFPSASDVDIVEPPTVVQSGSSPLPEVVSDDKRLSREEWRRIVAEDGASDVEVELELNSSSPPLSGESHDHIESRLSGDRLDMSRWEDPTQMPPPERRGVARRQFDNQIIDQWNALFPTLTPNPWLHREMFEMYILTRELESGAIKIMNNVDMEGAPPDMEFEYSNDMLYNQCVPDPEMGLGCSCDGPCDPTSRSCSCVRRQELYFYGINNLNGFAYDEHGKVRNLSVPIWECGETCGCPPECMNRVIQRGRNPSTKLEIVKTKYKGWGIQAGTRIPRGTFIGIYAGEVITEEESEARGELYSEIGRTYIFDLDGWQIRNPPAGLRDIDPRLADIAEASAERARLTVEDVGNPNYVYNAYSVDAFHYGVSKTCDRGATADLFQFLTCQNYTRYINHSCDPNLEITQCYVKDFHPERPILVIFARRDVAPKEELCISYKGVIDDEDEVQPSFTPEKKTTKKGKKRQSKTSASAHIVTRTERANAEMDKNTCLCGARQCDGKMFNL